MESGELEDGFIDFSGQLSIEKKDLLASFILFSLGIKALLAEFTGFYMCI